MRFATPILIYLKMFQHRLSFTKMGWIFTQSNRRDRPREKIHLGSVLPPQTFL